MTKLDRVLHKSRSLSPEQEQQLQHTVEALLRLEPVQYITGTCWFYGMELQVNPQVLIPRPETEELVDWILQDHTGPEALHMLDIGTGSGCIPLALKNSRPAATVTGIDVSEGALTVARGNASRLQLDVTFSKVNVLDTQETAALPAFHVIVSNPPYILQSEQSTMQEQVWGFEPSLALFVPDNDPLLFYRYISQLAATHLITGGHLYFETNEALANEVAALMKEEGFQEVEVKQDIFGKERMVKGKWPV